LKKKLLFFFFFLLLSRLLLLLLFFSFEIFLRVADDKPCHLLHKSLGETQPRERLRVVRQGAAGEEEALGPRGEVEAARGVPSGRELPLEVGHRRLRAAPLEELKVRLGSICFSLLLLLLLLPLGGGDPDEDLDLWKGREEERRGKKG